jgi:hypothetical protein
MVTLTINQITMEVTKLTHSLKPRISGYLSDEVDRSHMKINILPFIKIAFSVEIKTTLLNHILYKVEICAKSEIEENTVKLESLYKSIKNFSDTNSALCFLLDKNYNIIGFMNTGRDYVPYKLDEKELIEANVSNSYSFLEDIQKDADNYFIITFPDLLVTVDKYTADSYLGLMVKSYVDNRFPVLDKESGDRRIISFSGFQLIYAHMKSILNVKSTVTYYVKACFDNMNKMNMLPRIPYKNYWINGTGITLKTDRLMKMIIKKESLSDKVRNIINGKKEVDNDDILLEKDISKDDDKLIFTKNDDETVVIDIPEIPEYFSHAFDEEFVCMLWSDFMDEYAEWEVNNPSILNSFGEEFLMDSVIIIPEDNIGTVKREDINFIGFDGDKFYISINCKFDGEKELDLRNTIATYFQRKFGHSVDIVLDEIIEVKETSTQLSLLKDGEYDDYVVVGE